MIQYLTRDLINHITVFQAAMLVIILTNIWLMRRSRKHSMPLTLPRVSILVPARNEASQIEACILSLLGQKYPDYEVLVLDDQSTDSTSVKLEQLVLDHDRLKVISGLPAPHGIAGKNWACAQLAEPADGELLFFTDADTVYQDDALATIVSAMLGEKADLLTGFPRQVVKTWGERLLVPFFSWASLNFIPFGLAYLLRSTVLAIAVGQIMVFTRKAYETVGGHAALGTNILDDIVLARRIKAAGLRWRVVRISDLVSCHMYDNSRDAYEGLTKNLFGAFGYRLLPYLFIIIWLVTMTWVPILVFALWLAGQTSMVHAPVLMVCLGLPLLTWLLTLIEIKAPVVVTLLYPLSILANAWVMLRSLVFSLGGKLQWKDRMLEKPRWKWL